MNFGIEQYKPCRQNHQQYRAVQDRWLSMNRRSPHNKNDRV
jgi:hypothetical protein